MKHLPEYLVLTKPELWCHCELLLPSVFPLAAWLMEDNDQAREATWLCFCIHNTDSHSDDQKH